MGSSETIFPIWNNFWDKHNPDNVFAYKTLKMVTIKDRYLGFLHYGLQVGIVLYIVLYVIFFNTQFLDKQNAIGFVRLSVSTQGKTDTSPKPYCKSNSQPFCLYPSQDQLSDGAGSSVFITTYYNLSVLVSSCNYTETACEPTVVRNAEYYVAGLDNVVISLDHKVSQVGSHNGPPLGELQTQKNSGWEKCDKCARNQYESHAADTISLADLLEATQLNLSDDATSYLNGTPNYYPADYRRYGAVILLFISYDNIQHYFVGSPKLLYFYQPQLMTSVDDYEYEAIYDSFPENRTLLYKKGIRIVGIISGSVGIFSFQTLMINLITSLTLLKFATVAVDLIAINILPRRMSYKKAKFEKTEGFNTPTPRSRVNSSADSLSPPQESSAVVTVN